MIGTKLCHILCKSFFAMLGFIWMLVDSIYHIIRPLERHKESDTKKSIENCDKEISLNSESKQLDISDYQVNPINDRETSIVNLDVKYICKQKLISATQDVLGRRTALKRPRECISRVRPENSDSGHKNSLHFVVVKHAFKKKNELRDDLIISIREISKFMNKSMAADGGESYKMAISHGPDAKRQGSILKLSNADLGLERKCETASWPLDLDPTMQIRRIKLSNNQIIALQETAHNMINQLSIEVTSHLRRKFKEMEISDFFDIINDCSSLAMKQTKTSMEPNVIITELDSAEEIEVTKKHRSQRKKKYKKKQRKNKLNNQKLETNSVKFSSKQCFERLAFFMSTNQRLTQSKMMLEIEKEFKPIKDQISELRESMTDFVVVNHKTKEKGIKSSKLSVKPIDKSGPKPRSIFTVPSLSLQRLARLAETSNNSQENCYQEIAGNEPKKLSPLAEMYIKLSRQ